MISYQQIRGAALQFLYSGTFQPVDSDSEKPRWDMVLAYYRHRLNRARAKAILHLTRAYFENFANLNDALEKARPFLNDMPLAIRLRDALVDIMTREAAFQKARRDIRSKADTIDDDDWPENIGNDITDLLAVNEALIHMRADIPSLIADVPGADKVCSHLRAALHRMQEVSKRVNSMRTAHGSTKDSEFGHVIEAREDLDKLTADSKKLADDVAADLEECDALISQALTGTTIDRINSIDLDILRMGAYELKHNKEVNTPVILGAYIKLAQTFSSTEATRFVNGVLSGVAKITRA